MGGIRHIVGRRRDRVLIILALGALCLLSAGLNGWLQIRRVSEHSAQALQSVSQRIHERELQARVVSFARQDRLTGDETARWLDVIANVTSSPSKDLLPPRASTDDSLPQSESELYWAFDRLGRVPIPNVRQSDEIRNPIDAFVGAEFATRGRHLLAAAPHAVLVRRLWFDLLGLPPSPGEVEPWLDGDADELDHLVELLLGDPRFGEHLALDWLDLSRYADSNGYEEDELRPQAYPFRDFVVWALNSDLALTEFVRWQIAGDELQPNNPLAVAATGFMTASAYNTFLPQASERFDELDDMVSTLGTAMLGLTVGCARCHDHPYDPIRIEDYYSLVAVFYATQRETRYLQADAGAAYLSVAGEVLQYREELEQLLLSRLREDNIQSLPFSEFEKDLLRQPIDHGNAEQIDALSRCGRCLMVDVSSIEDDLESLEKDRERFEFLRSELSRIEPGLPPQPPMALSLSGSNISQIPVLYGGALEHSGPIVGPGFPEALTPCGDASASQAWRTWDAASHLPRPRTALANWIVDLERGTGPLLARVTVNRIWQHYFGQGLVASSGDFGANGSGPTVPDLMDWLAGELIRNNWSQKHIHRLIVNSATYRQRCVLERELEDGLAELRACVRPLRRQTAEMFRDSILRLGGNLTPCLFGPAFQPPIPVEAIFARDEEDVDATWPTDVLERPEVWRRSLYILRRRTNPVPMMQLFDVPNNNMACAQRTTTVVPTQALALLNDPLVRSQAQRIAHNCEVWPAPGLPKNPTPSIERLFQRVLGRRPTPRELRQIGDYVNSTGSLADVCHVLLMSNEFWYIE